jgi:hypothetical protein
MNEPQEESWIDFGVIAGAAVCAAVIYLVWCAGRAIAWPFRKERRWRK